MNGATLVESFLTSGSGIITFNSVLHPLVLPGETYWISLSVDPTSTGYYAWNLNNQAILGGSAVRRSENGLWKTTHADRATFDVTVSAVPEPATLILAGTGIIITMARRRRRRRTA